MRRLRVSIAVILAVFAGTVLQPTPAAAASFFEVAQHNIGGNSWGALDYVARVDKPLVLTSNEVCAGRRIDYINRLPQYGYSLRTILVDDSALACNGQGLYNLVATKGQIQYCGVNPCGPRGRYDSSILPLDERNRGEYRSYVCLRATFIYRGWGVCTTHTSGLGAFDGFAYFQTAIFKNSVLANGIPKSYTKLAGGDFNLRPRVGTYNMSAFHASYREADQYHYNRNEERRTTRPGGGLINAKIDYFFAGKFWTSDAFGRQDMRCATTSDHCVLVGGFFFN